MPEYSPEQLEQEALTWLVRGTSGAMSEEQARQLADWLQQSQAHRDAFDAARQLWEGLGALRERPTLRAARGPAQTSTAIARRSIRKSRLTSLAAAASLLLCAVLLSANPSLWQAWRAQYRTGVGEQKTVVLADGSTVHLNAVTALDPSFSASRRRIRLFDGEAEFIVAKDKSRPFTVEVDGYEVTALGTDFVVKKQANALTVTMLESAVNVGLPSSSAFAPTVVKTGQRWAVDGRNKPVLSAINLHAATAWRQRRLVFESEPLTNVIAEINRYRGGHVFLGNAALAGFRVSGAFNIDHLDTLLNVINKTLPVKSVALAGRYTVLY